MKKYEYKLIPAYEAAIALTEQALNELGSQGWQLINTVGAIVLMREKSD